MKHPYFREAHGTDEHYVEACFLAGAIGDMEDSNSQGVLGAELWELVSFRGPSRFAVPIVLTFVVSEANVSRRIRLGHGQGHGRSKH